MTSNIIKNAESSMTSSLSVYKEEIDGIQTGRASAALLNPITVKIYGTGMPINQLASITASDARTLTIQVWDANNTSTIQKAILNSNLGINPIVEGNTIRLPIPPTNQERRAELVKLARDCAEKARIAIRNIRRKAIDDIKSANKSGDCTDDERDKAVDGMQKVTDKYNDKINEILSKKETDITSV